VAEFRTRPGLFTHFREPLMSELRKIWDQLYAVLVAPYRLYSHTDGHLYFQLYDPNTKKYISKARLKSDGTWETTGTQNRLATIPDVGGKGTP